MKLLNLAYTIMTAACAFLGGLAFGRGAGDWDRNLGFVCLGFMVICIVVQLTIKKKSI